MARICKRLRACSGPTLWAGKRTHAHATRHTRAGKTHATRQKGGALFWRGVPIINQVGFCVKMGESRI